MTGRLSFLDAVSCKGYLWFSAMEWNGCYRADPRTGKSELIGFFEKEPPEGRKLYLKTVLIGERAYFIPWTAGHLACIDTGTLRLREWELPQEALKERWKFRTAAVYDGKIYMFPSKGWEIFIFDTETEQFAMDSGWAEEYRRRVSLNMDNKFYKCCQRGDTVYLANFSGNFLMKYCCGSGSFEFIRFGGEAYAAIGAVFGKDGELLVLTTEGCVWKYELSTREKSVLWKEERLKAYRHLICAGGMVLLVPFLPGSFLALREETPGRVQEIPIGGEFRYECLTQDGVISAYWGYEEAETEVYFYPCLMDGALRLSLKDLSVEKICFPEEDRGKRQSCIIESCVRRGEVLSEGRIGLEAYLSWLSGKKAAGRNQAGDSVGRRIWEKLREEKKY